MNPFLAAIKAAPDDDLPRLVYADWLDENGQPEYADFIRIQIAYYRTGDIKLTEPQVQYCIHVFRKITPKLPPLIYGQRWQRTFSIATESDGNPFGQHTLEQTTRSPMALFERGFITHIVCECNDWMVSFRELITNCVLSSVRLSDKTPYSGYRSGGFRWYINGLNSEPQYCLPRRLMNALSGGYRIPQRGAELQYVEYPTQESAYKALSDACLALPFTHPDAT